MQFFLVKILTNDVLKYKSKIGNFIKIKTFAPELKKKSQKYVHNNDEVTPKKLHLPDTIKQVYVKSFIDS